MLKEFLHKDRITSDDVKLTWQAHAFETIHWTLQIGAGVAQLLSVFLSELEVPGSILGDSNVFFDFFLICVALAFTR